MRRHRLETSHRLLKRRLSVFPRRGLGNLEAETCQLNFRLNRAKDHLSYGQGGCNRKHLAHQPTELLASKTRDKTTPSLYRSFLGCDRSLNAVGLDLRRCNASE